MSTGMCKDCIQGSIHEGEAKGEVTTVHGFDTYVAHPPSTAGESPAVIVLLPDGLGWTGPNLRLTADRYAARTGCKVYLPDFMAGRSMPQWLLDFPIEEIAYNWTSPRALFWKPYYIFWSMWVVIPFRLKNGYPESHKRVVKFLTELRKTEEGRKKLVGVAGFCWGGKHAFLLGAKKSQEGDKPYLIDFAFSGHPSSLEVPKEIDELECPMSVAMGTDDFMNSVEFSKDLKDRLEKKEGRAQGSHLVFWEGGNHGFACRADLKNERLKECADGAEDQFVSWVHKMAETIKPIDSD
ncbi:hypothetical protein H072_3896 [Dactylellina haptotyla CBS 200.50]|uniref:Dienelactone hydrolase domain-containing protein n=1 Tax=Dactylellina haptotyla (strain CBS 200.50) TaxID=1284197 RepID=S8BRW1_DACHA|nr:hypothetical protein H072_3896 [Dactylellina haptotyla CBS 200.50]